VTHDRGYTVDATARHHERSLRDEDTEAIAERTRPGDVEEHVEALRLPREVLPTVVENSVRTKRTDHFQFPSAGYRGDVRAERLCDLHGEGADTTARAVNEDALPGLHTRRVANALERCDACDRQRGGFPKREPRRLGNQPDFLRARVLGKRAGCATEYLVARLEASDVPADRLDGAGDVHAAHSDSRASQAEEQAGGRRRVNEVRIVGVDRSRVYPNEYTIVRDRWQPDLAQPQYVGRPVAFLDDRFHGVGAAVEWCRMGCPYGSKWRPVSM